MATSERCYLFSLLYIYGGFATSSSLYLREVCDCIPLGDIIDVVTRMLAVLWSVGKKSAKHFFLNISGYL